MRCVLVAKRLPTDRADPQSHGPEFQKIDDLPGAVRLASRVRYPPRRRLVVLKTSGMPVCGSASSVGRSQPAVRRDCHSRSQTPPSADRPHTFGRDVNESRSKRNSCAKREHACGRKNDMPQARKTFLDHLMRLLNPPKQPVAGEPPAATPPAAPPRTSPPEPLAPRKRAGGGGGPATGEAGVGRLRPRAFERQPNTSHCVNHADANSPTRSPSSPAHSACRTRSMPTEPK